jgi:hypothetical protein
MIHNRAIVVFQPAGGKAANQQVFIDLTPGTMTVTRTNASGLLVSASGTAVPMDDSRDESATRSAGALRWTGSKIPDVDLVGAIHRTVRNPAANRRQSRN